MSPPKHLWSGTWEDESAAAARARRQSELRDQAPPEDLAPAAAPASMARPKPAATAQPPVAPQPKSPGWRPPRFALALALLTLVLIGGAYALASSGGPGAQRPTSTPSPTLPGILPPINPPSSSTSSSQSGTLAWLGVQLDYWPAGGAFVGDTDPGSPAAAAGLHQGDVIMQVDGRDVNGPGDVVQAIDSHRPGDSLSLQIERGGDTLTVRATLAPRGQQSQYP